MKETGDYRMCAAHDLAPIVEKAFGIHPKDLTKNKGFGRLVDAGGLGALDKRDVWRGLGRRLCALVSVAVMGLPGYVLKVGLIYFLSAQSGGSCNQVFGTIAAYQIWGAVFSSSGV